jgi:hypothetical protein
MGEHPHLPPLSDFAKGRERKGTPEQPAAEFPISVSKERVIEGVNVVIYAHTYI